MKQTEKVQFDPNTVGMSLEHRLDINQVDLSPLMSTILSIPVPVNSKVSISGGMYSLKKDKKKERKQTKKERH